MKHFSLDFSKKKMYKLILKYLQSNEKDADDLIFLKTCFDFYQAEHLKNDETVDELQNHEELQNHDETRDNDVVKNVNNLKNEKKKPIKKNNVRQKKMIQKTMLDNNHQQNDEKKNKETGIETRINMDTLGIDMKNFSKLYQGEFEFHSSLPEEENEVCYFENYEDL